MSSADSGTPEPTDGAQAADEAAGATATATEAPPEEQAPEIDETRAQMLALLEAELGDAIVGVHAIPGDLWVRVRPDTWRRTAAACKAVLECDYFCWLAGMDWLPNPDLPARSFWDEEKTAAEIGAGNQTGEPLRTGYAGGDTRFQVMARLYSTKRHWGITLKADLDEANPSVETISDVYHGADWHEREAWEMFGFDFPGHSGLRHLYLPGGFEGHPLRKDFPLLSREVKPWPGLVDKEPLPGEEAGADEEEGAE